MKKRLEHANLFRLHCDNVAKVPVRRQAVETLLCARRHVHVFERTRRAVEHVLGAGCIEDDAWVRAVFKMRREVADRTRTPKLETRVDDGVTERAIPLEDVPNGSGALFLEHVGVLHDEKSELGGHVVLQRLADVAAQRTLVIGVSAVGCRQWLAA